MIKINGLTSSLITPKCVFFNKQIVDILNYITINPINVDFPRLTDTLQGGENLINQSRYRLFLMISSALATLSVAMFIYQHFFYEASRLKEMTTVYVVAAPIDAHTTVDPGDLKEVKIPAQSLIDGMITDLSMLTETPHYAIHRLTKGEILVTSQLTTDNLNAEGTLLVPLEGNYISDVIAGDMVSFYTIVPIYSDNSPTQFTVKKLFNSKKVYSNGRFNTVDAVIEGENVALYIKVTEEEMNAYYQALKTSEIIVAKHMIDMNAVIDNLKDFQIQDYNGIVQDPSTSTDANSNNVSQNGNNLNTEFIGNNGNNSQEENELIGTIKPPLADEDTTTDDTEADRSTVRYRVGENETWETIAIKFKTDKNTLYKLNPNTLTIHAGAEIIVPSI